MFLCIETHLLPTVSLSLQYIYYEVSSTIDDVGEVVLCKDM
jgi:hypothetical protein